MGNESSNDDIPRSRTRDDRENALYERAKTRLAAVDAKSDSKDDGDESLRQEALSFIRKECMNLPDKEFMLLLSKIEEALRRRDAEISTVIGESQAALKEISQELSLLPYSNFELGVANPKGVAEYLEAAVRTKGGERTLMEALRKNSDAIAGFVTNWNEKHPVRKALIEMGNQWADAARRLDFACANERWSAERSDGEGVDYRSRFTEIRGAKEDFDKLITPEFKSTRDPKTNEAVIGVFKRLGGSSLADPYEMILRDAKTTLAFVREWAKYPNPLAEAMKHHPDQNVRTGCSILESAAIFGAVKYGFDVSCLPHDFERVAKEKLERFEKREKRAEEVTKWNEESRSFLIGKWNELVKARMEGDTNSVSRISEETNAFFNGEFQKRHESANEYFFWLVKEQQPLAYREFQSIAGTRQLFAGMASTIGDKIPDSEGGMKGTVDKYEVNFRSMIWGEWAYLLAKNENGETDTVRIENFIHDVSWETVTQTVRDPEWIGRYLSYAFVRGWKKDFAAMIRSDFGNDYDALILKFADTAGYVSKWLAENSGKWDEIMKILSYTDKDAGGTFWNFLKKEAEAILANREAIGDEWFWLLKKELVHRHGETISDTIISQMRGKSTKEQFDVLLRNCPEYTHGQIERLFVELSKHSDLAADAHKKEAARIIPGDEKMEYVPGFVRLKFALAQPVGKETVREAETRTDLLRALQESDRMTADAFFEEYSHKADYLIRALEKRAAEFPIEKADCEVFAAWIRHKSEGAKKREGAIVQAEVARTARELASLKWPDAKASEDRNAYEKRMDEVAEFAKRAVLMEMRADSLESEGKRGEADELRRKVAASRKERDAEETRDTDRTKIATDPVSAAEAIASGLQVGLEVKVPFGGTSSDIRVMRTNDSANPFVVSVDGKPSYSCSEKNLAANLQMADLLSKNGLAFLAPVSGELLRRSSVAKGNLATAADGDFGDREKRELLSAAAKALKIEGFPHASTDLSEMSARLSRISRDENSSVREIGIRNGVLDESGNLKNREEFLASAT